MPDVRTAPPPAAPPRTRWGLVLVAVTIGAGLVAWLLLADPLVRRAPRDASVEMVYLADEGDLVDVAFTRDAAAAAERPLHDELWAEWSAMIPPYWSRRVAEFEISSDGPGGTAASVRRLDRAGDRWLLSVDPADAMDRHDDYVHTLVHELAHIVTLGGGRVEVDRSPASTLVEQAARCDGPPVQEGCAAPDSLLAAFSEAFWDLDEVGAPDGVATVGDHGDPADREDATIERYLAAPDSYVSAYAASSPTEDVAETFVALVLGQRQPPGSVAAAKVAFLRADVELYSIADRIRATLALRPRP